MKKVTKFEVPVQKEKKLRVAAYARVSTDSDEQLTSLDAQKTYYDKLIRSNPKWEYAGLYFDEGISGTKMDRRDGLLSMMEDCRQGKIDFIIVKSISRLARNTVDTLNIVRELSDLRIYLFFEKENINTQSMNGELLLSILSGMAQSESTSISANEKWSVQKRFQAGTFIISFPPYGYKNDNGQMVVVPEEAEAVRFMFAEALKGNGTYRIAGWLNERNIPARRGGKWNASVVGAILHNEKYTGDVIFQKTWTDDRFNRHKNNGELKRYKAASHHEALISQEDYDAVQAIMKHNGKEHGNNAEEDPQMYHVRYPFSGKIICGECGSTFKHRVHKVIDGTYGTFTCGTHLRDTSKCGMLYICEDSLNAAFTTMLNKLILYRSQVLKPLYETIRSLSNQSNQDETDKIDALLAEKHAERKRVLDLFTKGFLDSAVYQRQCIEIDRAIEDLTARQNEIARIQDDGKHSFEELETLYRFCENNKPFHIFPEELVDKFVTRVVINVRDEATFELRCGLHLKERMEQ